MDNHRAYDNRLELGKHVRSLREEQGLTLRRFALMAGMSYTHLSRLERGQVNVSIDELTKIAEGLDAHLAELFIGM